MTNLEIRCAELGRNLAGINGMDEKVLNAALAVLEEQGPYAMLLYLAARHQNVFRQVDAKTLEFLKGICEDKLNQATKSLDAVQILAENLDDLLFVRDLLRTALSYARYHLKARGGSGS
jgi:hypothetical protein